MSFFLNIIIGLLLAGQTGEFRPYFSDSPEREGMNEIVLECQNQVEQQINEMKRTKTAFTVNAQRLSEKEFRVWAVTACVTASLNPQEAVPTYHRI